jgi:hypothetical protein
MAKSENSGGKKKKRSPKSVTANPPKSAASQLPQATQQQKDAARKKHDEGVLERNEAVEVGKPMTPGTTHQIIGYRPDGSPILKRTRFSLF